jgi:hypothetical protein
MAKAEEQAKKNAEEGQPLVNAWHDRMREHDQKVPKFVRVPDNDPKRGAMSPLGGKIW